MGVVSGGAEMIEFENIRCLIWNYVSEKQYLDKTERFCNEYMDVYFDLSDKFEMELSRPIFELLDDINLVCDSYEKDEAIREMDKYCLDEKGVYEKVSVIATRIEEQICK